MASNGRGSSNRSAGASNTVAATAMGSVETRFPQREWRWGCCLGGLSCFASQKGGRRIAPGVPEGNTSTIRANGPQPVGLTNQATTITPSLLAPPSSPASFTNSALPSTAQSPSCFLSISANSPGGPSSTMFATGPYAHETQLVSPPGFSAVTTEPSTAPLTPPPELAHHTTPSSPDVPFAHFRSSSMDLKNAGKSSYTAANDLQATYPLYHGSPASSLISPILGTSGEGVSSSFTGQESPTQWGASISTQGSQFPQSGSSRLFGLGTATSKNFMLSQDSSFFCPATSAQFYLDQAQQSFPHCGPRLSLSREADVYSSGGNGHQNRHSKNCKPDAEEIEAYRASFGFSADEIITTPQYVEISDVLDESFTMTPFASSDKPFMEQSLAPKLLNKEKMQTSQNNLLDHDKGVDGVVQDKSCNGCEDYKSQKQSGNVSEPNEPGDYVSTDEEDIFLKMGDSNISKRYRLGLSSSDAEIDYRRGRSLREGKGDFSWRD